MNYTIRPYNPATDIPVRVALYNAQFPETPMTMEQNLEQERLRPTDRVSQRLVAEDDQQILGYSFSTDKGVPNTTEFIIVCLVAHHARGNGIGTQLLQQGVAFARDHGAVRMFAFVRDDDPLSLRFAEKLGFSKLNHEFDVALDLTAFDANRLLELDQFKPGAGVRLTDLETWGDMLEHRRAFHALMIETLADMPGEPMFETFEQFLPWLERKSYFASGVLLILDAQGNAVGFSWLMFDASTGQIENWGTGIKREYRRQGLAWALKLSGIRWARAHGAKRIVTANHEGNEGMRVINQRLGFERQLGLYEMELRLQNQQETV
jgi:mycothiol synthase